MPTKAKHLKFDDTGGAYVAESRSSSLLIDVEEDKYWFERLEELQNREENVNKSSRRVETIDEEQAMALLKREVLTFDEIQSGKRDGGALMLNNLLKKGVHT